MQEGASVQQPNRENPEFLINACMYTKVYIFNVFNKERIKTQVLISLRATLKGPLHLYQMRLSQWVLQERQNQHEVSFSKKGCYWVDFSLLIKHLPYWLSNLDSSQIPRSNKLGHTRTTGARSPSNSAVKKGLYLVACGKPSLLYYMLYLPIPLVVWRMRSITHKREPRICCLQVCIKALIDWKWHSIGKTDEIMMRKHCLLKMKKGPMPKHTKSVLVLKSDLFTLAASDGWSVTRMFDSTFFPLTKHGVFFFGKRKISKEQDL